MEFSKDKFFCWRSLSWRCRSSCRRWGSLWRCRWLCWCSCCWGSPWCCHWLRWCSCCWGSLSLWRCRCLSRRSYARFLVTLSWLFYRKLKYWNTNPFYKCLSIVHWNLDIVESRFDNWTITFSIIEKEWKTNLITNQQLCKTTVKELWLYSV